MSRVDSLVSLFTSGGENSRTASSVDAVVCDIPEAVCREVLTHLLGYLSKNMEDGEYVKVGPEIWLGKGDDAIENQSTERYGESMVSIGMLARRDRRVIR